LGVDADDTGDLDLRHAVAGKRLDVPSADCGWLVRGSSHGQASSRAERGGRSSSGRDSAGSAADGDTVEVRAAEQETPRSSATSTKVASVFSRTAVSPVKSCQ